MKLCQGRLKEDKNICFLFICTEGVWYCVAGWFVVKIVGHGCEGHVIKKMYEASRSVVLLEGEKSAVFIARSGTGL